jgi:hypothetical protein
VRVLHPGFANLEGGPDFRGAVLQIGGDAPCSGDVEVDLRVGGWRKCPAARGVGRSRNERGETARDFVPEKCPRCAVG